MPQSDGLESIISMMQLGAYNDAARASQTFLDADPDNPVVQNILGAALAETGEMERSIELLRNLVQKFPDYSFAFHNLGNILVKSGDPNVALPYLRKAVETAPEQAEIHSSLANALEKTGDLAGALNSAKTAVSLAPEATQYRKRLASYFRQLAMLEEALIELNAALVLDPSDYEVLTASGEILTNLKRSKEALANFHKAAIVKPDYVDIYVGVGLLWLRGNQMQKSIEAFQKAAVFAPNDVGILKNLAEAYIGAGEIDQAIAVYKTCVELDSTDALAQHFLAALAQADTATAPPEYVRSLFDAYAETFEQSLVGNLEYRGPDIISERLTAAFPSIVRYFSFLDLGCGTGLMGEKMRVSSDYVSGVDLSENMIKIARAKSVYDQLRVGDITDLVRKDQDRHDLYIAADVLVYIGDLTGLFSAISETARSGAIFAFTTEHREGEGYKLLNSGRYSHASIYVEENIKKYNMTLVESGLFDLRYEHGTMLRGAYYITRARFK